MPRPLGSGNKKKPMQGWKKCSYLAHPESHEVLNLLSAARGIDISQLIETALRGHFTDAYQKLPMIREALREGATTESELVTQESRNPKNTSGQKPSTDSTPAAHTAPRRTEGIQETQDDPAEEVELEREIYITFESRVEACDQSDLAIGLAQLVRRSDPTTPLSEKELDTAGKEIQEWKRRHRIPDMYRSFLDEFFEDRH